MLLHELLLVHRDDVHRHYLPDILLREIVSICESLQRISIDLVLSDGSRGGGGGAGGLHGLVSQAESRQRRKPA